MFTYASEVTIARPAREVFAAIIDIAGWSEWTDMRDVRHDQPGTITVGSTGTFTLPGGLFTGPIRYELTRLEPDQRVAYAMTHPAFAWTAEMRVEPAAGGSHLATSGAFRLRGWRRILQPIVAREVSRGEAAELDRMKAILETAPPPAIDAVQES